MRIKQVIALSGAALLAGAGLGVLTRPARPRSANGVGSRLTDGPGSTWSLLVAVYNGILEDRVMSVAAGVAFYAMLSLIPAISVLLSIYGLFTPISQIPAQLDSISGLLPLAGRELVREHAMRLAAQPNGTLSLALVFSLALAGWSANAATKALFDGLNVMFGRTETRSFIRLNLLSLALTFAGVLMIIVALSLLAVLPKLLEHLPVSEPVGTLIVIIRWPVLTLCCFLAILMLYRSGPDRPPPKTWMLLPGATAATVLWACASELFSWYVSSVASYSAVYGSLAAVVILLTWMWLSAVITLTGGELTAGIESRWS